LQEKRGNPPCAYAPFVAACLVKLDLGLTHMSQLRQFLVEHPALVWLLGYPLRPSPVYTWGFDVTASLPTHRHFTRLLREIPNECLQFLLDSSVACLQAELTRLGIQVGECISMDTKHILAWVKENNRKAYVSDRYDKDKQPPGDPDCRLGCKRRHNQSTASRKSAPPTPTTEPVPADTIEVGEFYWGYASGLVATKVPGWGELILAELTQPFDRGDVTYFYPLMTDTERRLGFRPKYAALDAAFDAFYIYDYFHDVGGFAAVPFSQRGGYTARRFDDQGQPFCEADLPMPLKNTFIDHASTLFDHERGRYACPLLFPQPSGQTCPVNHKNWAKGGCICTMPTSVGARIRYTLPRDSDAYKQVYKQRTATERINAQAVQVGIERPHIRNGRAIANQNTLIYILLNLRLLQRIHQRQG
jgi:hypothetical protein